jgi:hypothetical protein
MEGRIHFSVSLFATNQPLELCTIAEGKSSALLRLLAMLPRAFDAADKERARTTASGAGARNAVPRRGGDLHWRSGRSCNSARTRR